MRVNWGLGIVIAFALFMSFILYFVVKVQSNSKYDNELVVAEYYKKDMHYEQEIRELQNAEDLSERPEIASVAQGIEIAFPKAIADSVRGTVALYRPSASKMDFELPIRLENARMLVPAAIVPPGQWLVTLEWSGHGKKFMVKKKVFRTK